MLSNYQYQKIGLFSRIYLVFLARKALCPRGVGVSLLVLASLVLFWLVSIVNIARNFWYHVHDIGGAYSFVTGTFIHTEVVVQVVTVSVLAICTFFALDMYRSFFYTR